MRILPYLLMLGAGLAVPSFHMKACLANAQSSTDSVRDSVQYTDDSIRCRESHICDNPDVGCSAAPAEEYRSWDAKSRDAFLACTTQPSQRAAAVEEAISWSWKGYKECAWGHDELQPLSCQGSHWLNLSLTLVDSLDTLYLAGQHQDFAQAAEHVIHYLDVRGPGEVNLFETTIRILGGLLSAHYLSSDSHPDLSIALGRKAVQLGDRLLPALRESPSGLPFSDVNLRTGEVSTPQWARVSSLSEIATLSLEFTHLSRLTGRPEFEEAALRVHQHLSQTVEAGGGLMPMYFNPKTGGVATLRASSWFTMGARADSYYEYLLKQWVLSGRRDALLLGRYTQAMQAVRSRLVRRTQGGAGAGEGLVFVGELGRSGETVIPKMDHLVCFLPGLLALGDFHGANTSLPVPPANLTKAHSSDEPLSSDQASSDGSTDASTAGSTDASTAGSTDASTAGSTDASTAGSTDASTAGSTDASTAGSTDASTAGSTDASTAATAGSTDASIAGGSSGTKDEGDSGGSSSSSLIGNSSRSSSSSSSSSRLLTSSSSKGLCAVKDAGGWADGMADLDLAEQLAATCYEMYRGTPSGLAPEIVHFKDESEEGGVFPKQHHPDVGRGHFFIKSQDAHNLLRPETVESLYVLWKVTGRPRYREWAWAIFRAFQLWARVDAAQQCLVGGVAVGGGGGGGQVMSNATSAAHSRRGSDGGDDGGEEREGGVLAEGLGAGGQSGGGCSAGGAATLAAPGSGTCGTEGGICSTEGGVSGRGASSGQAREESGECVVSDTPGQGAPEGGAVKGGVLTVDQMLQRLGERILRESTQTDSQGGPHPSCSSRQTSGGGTDAGCTACGTEPAPGRKFTQREGGGDVSNVGGSRGEAGEAGGRGGVDGRGGGAGGSCMAWVDRAGGYSNLQSVLRVPPPRRDKMESFWLAETLKYLYLIFTEPPERCLHASCAALPAERSAKQAQHGGTVGDPLDWTPLPGVPKGGQGGMEGGGEGRGGGTRISLREWVFNTEAHPLPVSSGTLKAGVGADRGGRERGSEGEGRAATQASDVLPTPQ